MKFNEDYISLLAGLVDEDHLEETRHKVHDVLQEIDEVELKYVSDEITLLEYIGFREEPYEGVSDLDRERATAAHAQPKSAMNGGDDDDEPIPNTGDWKYYTPDHTVRKCIDHESGEYKKKTPLPSVQKWKSNTLEFESKQNNFLDKYSLEENCGMGAPDMGEMGYMGDMLDDLENPKPPQAGPSMEIMATASIPIPASTLVTLTTVQDPGPATNIVLTIGADGVPMSYIHKALEELAMDPSSVEAHNELAELVGKPPVGDQQTQDIGGLDPIASMSNWATQDYSHE